MSTIGERLRVAREGSVMTQEQLSTLSKVPVVTISRIENDRYAGRPRISTIQKLAGALNVQPAWLMFGEEEMEKPAAA